MDYNYLYWFLAALVPAITGFIWYHPKVFGTSWMKLNNLTQRELDKGNMALILGVCYVLSLLLAVGLTGLVVHQAGFFSLFAMDYEKAGQEEIKALVDNVMTTYGDRHRSFGHGALHGGLAALMFALPVLGINALFERRNWKYIAIHTGYWFVTLLLMGGILCQFI